MPPSGSCVIIGISNLFRRNYNLTFFQKMRAPYNVYGINRYRVNCFTFLETFKNLQIVTIFSVAFSDLYFDHFSCTSISLLRPLYFELFTSTRLLRPFVKSGLVIGPEVQVEVQFWSKWSFGRSKVWLKKVEVKSVGEIFTSTLLRLFSSPDLTKGRSKRVEVKSSK